MTTRPTPTSTDPATAYALDVAAGRIAAGPHVRDACRRHLRDLEEGPERGLIWDVAAAERFYGFCRDVLRLSEGQFDGTPFELEPSQKFICGSLFGWKRSDGFRRFRRAYIEQGKGNGKSPMVGAIGLYGLVADGEAGAQIYAAGATKEQASILFRDAVNMLDKAPRLSARIRRSGGPGREYNLAHLKSGSFFRPVSRETKKTGSGPRPHFALCDEVHEHPDGGVIEILERGFKFRTQPLLIMITNSGSDRKSICWQERKHAVAVAAGDVEDDTTFSYVCALDEGDDPFTDPDCWIKANPLLGVTITPAYLALQVKQARDIPAKANGIRRLHFCEWTDAESAWISRAAWEAIEDHSLDLEDFAGQRCCAGLDLSAKADLTAKALIFEDGFAEDGKPLFAAFVHGYTPADTLRARAERDGAPYDLWVDAGFLTATPGKKTRLDFVAQDLLDDVERFDLDFVAYDAFLIADFEAIIGDMGATLPMLDHPQGWNKRKRETEDGEEITLWMPGSVDELETLILEKRLRVHVNPALRAAVMSATFDRSPADLRRFTKHKATARIDMAVALAMAVGAATARSVGEKGGNMDDFLAALEAS
ncbi:terminase large subunit [Rhodovulum sulfidophilum]|uniref:Terminase large subunit n=1 Tax=Rhodovulum sulfidophilum TaxID=35806 RepID=A0ABS1RTA6_RHOSU|nr:terminase TerL endonuclease subunit [Rhodovulum sulfidophilum]MBL3608214.1 terminase large subunit [Rhodovulum sulfidophilum]MCE8456305.1 terminase large subunit [Rhodovulum sulfidophilum]